MTPIYWLASYPKSGNTWMRAFLHNYWFDQETPVGINDLGYIPGIAVRHYYDNALMVESGLLTSDEIDLLRPAMYRRYATLPSELNIHVVKLHDAYRCLPTGEPIFPPDVTGGVIHIVRNPLDVVISYANHSRASIDDSIKMLGESGKMAAATFFQPPQLPQITFSWSDHALSWVVQEVLRCITVRYEDMLEYPMETFSRVIQFVGWDVNIPRLEKALRFSSFDELKKQEQAQGFVERPPGVDSFFRKGKAGNWREVLTDAQVSAIIAQHREVMERFAYMPSND